LRLGKFNLLLSHQQGFYGMVGHPDTQSQHLTIKLFRFVGYSFLLLSLFDIVSIFIPLRLMNPEWEVQATTALVERVAAPLIGLALVFYQDIQLRAKWEWIVLKGLSWAALIVGILYFLILPLILANNARLDSNISTQFKVQLDRQMAQAEKFAQRLQQASSKAEINELLVRASGDQGLAPDLQGKDVKTIKQALLAKISAGKPNIRKQAEAAIADRRLNQLKLTVKIFLGAVVSGFSFIYIWILTRWTRQPRLERAEIDSL
jgi:hypothetical protein